MVRRTISSAFGGLLLTVALRCGSQNRAVAEEKVTR